MKHLIEELTSIIKKYNKCKDNDFEGIAKIEGEDGIFETCHKVFAQIPNGAVFQTKGFDSCGYDLNSWVFTWVDEKRNVDGVILDVENW